MQNNIAEPTEAQLEAYTKKEMELEYAVRGTLQGALLDLTESLNTDLSHKGESLTISKISLENFLVVFKDTIRQAGQIAELRCLQGIESTFGERQAHVPPIQQTYLQLVNTASKLESVALSPEGKLHLSKDLFQEVLDGSMHLLNAVSSNNQLGTIYMSVLFEDASTIQTSAQLQEIIVDLVAQYPELQLFLSSIKKEL